MSRYNTSIWSRSERVVVSFKVKIDILVKEFGTPRRNYIKYSRLHCLNSSKFTYLRNVTALVLLWTASFYSTVILNRICDCSHKAQNYCNIALFLCSYLYWCRVLSSRMWRSSSKLKFTDLTKRLKSSRSKCTLCKQNETSS